MRTIINFLKRHWRCATQSESHRTLTAEEFKETWNKGLDEMRIK